MRFGTNDRNRQAAGVRRESHQDQRAANTLPSFPRGIYQLACYNFNQVRYWVCFLFRLGLKSFLPISSVHRHSVVNPVLLEVRRHPRSHLCRIRHRKRLGDQKGTSVCVKFKRCHFGNTLFSICFTAKSEFERQNEVRVHRERLAQRIRYFIKRLFSTTVVVCARTSFKHVGHLFS